MECKLAARQVGLNASWVAKKAVMAGQELAVGQVVSSGDDSGVEVPSTVGEVDDFSSLYDDEDIFPIGAPPSLPESYELVKRSHSLDSVERSSPVSSVSGITSSNEDDMMFLAGTLEGEEYPTRLFAEEYAQGFNDDVLSLGVDDDQQSFGWCADNSLDFDDEFVMMGGDSDLFVDVKEESLIGLKKRSFSSRDDEQEEEKENNERPAQRRRLLSPIEEEEQKPFAGMPKETKTGSFSPVPGLDHLGDALCHKRTWETVEGVPRLEVVLQPLDRFYKDEGGANNFLICHVQLHGSVSAALFDDAKSPENLLTNSVPLDCHVETEDGTKLGVEDQSHLKLMNEPRLGLSRLHGEIKFRLERTSKNYCGRKLKVTVSLRDCPDVRTTQTHGIKVLSKRKKLKAEVRNKLTEQALSAHLKNVVN